MEAERRHYEGLNYMPYPKSEPQTKNHNTGREPSGGGNEEEPVGENLFTNTNGNTVGVESESTGNQRDGKGGFSQF